MSVQREQSNGVITAEEADTRANTLLSAEASSFKNHNNVKPQDSNGVPSANEEATTSGQIVSSTVNLNCFVPIAAKNCWDVFRLLKN